MKNAKLFRAFVLLCVTLMVAICVFSSVAYAEQKPTDPPPSKKEFERHEAAEKGDQAPARGAKGPALRAGANGEHTYAVDYFPEAYSAGYINLGASSGENPVNCYSGTNWWGDPCWYNTNKSKNNSIYIDYYNAACMNGQFLDVRTYIWATGNSGKWNIQKWDPSTIWGGYLGHDPDCDGDRSITREFHFYTAGHCGDPNYEVTFQGVFCICDIDGDGDTEGTREYMSFSQGLQEAWLSSDTTLEKRNSNTWWGTDGTDEAYDSGKVWVTMRGTPSAPIRMVYGGTKSAFGAGIDYVGCRTSYNIVDGGGGMPSLSRTSWNSGAAKYSVYTLDPAQSVDRWEFMGWYTNSSLTTRAPSQYNPLTSDQTFYGWYRRSVFNISTSVSHGNITGSDNNVALGTNKTIYYSPNSGYLLHSVTVDGGAVNITSYPDSYTFANVNADHSISVVYSAPTAGKTWAKT